jgi:hypothetical protein
MAKKTIKFVNFSKDKKVAEVNSALKKLRSKKKKIEQEIKSFDKELSSPIELKHDYQDITIKNLNDLYKVSNNQYLETYTDVLNKQMEITRLHKGSLDDLKDISGEIFQLEVDLLINKINCVLNKLESNKNVSEDKV